jgi:hypothetical protein
MSGLAQVSVLSRAALQGVTVEPLPISQQDSDGAPAKSLRCAAGLPDGVCQSDKDCGAGDECNLKNTTRVCRCADGLDNCQPPPPTGRCQRKPQKLAELSR